MNNQLHKQLLSQVISFDQSKKLAQLGVLQQSIFYRHVQVPDGCFYVCIGKNTWIPMYDREHAVIDVALGDYMCSAFTVGELFQMFPDYYLSWSYTSPAAISWKRRWISTVFVKNKDQERSGDVDWIQTVPSFDHHGESQAEALAELLISCIKVGAFSVEDVNNRLNVACL